MKALLVNAVMDRNHLPIVNAVSERIGTELRDW
jgi:hypothetical protein